MDWLTDNMISRMYGPRFLLLYAVVIGVTLSTSWLLITQLRYSTWGVSARQLKVCGIGIIVLLGGYKLSIALANGHYNVLFLIVMGTVGVSVMLRIKGNQ